MKITVQSIHFTADKKLLEFVDKKLAKMEQYYDHLIDGSVFLKLDKAENEENKIVEVKLNLPGNVLFVKEQCKTFEEAMDLAIESLAKQLKRHKEKEREKDYDREALMFDELAD